MGDANYLSISAQHFDTLTHYKDDRPLKWIKLDVNLFSSYEFSRLSDPAKLLLMSIWTLAARVGPDRIPADLDYLRTAAHLSDLIEETHLIELINNDFLEGSYESVRNRTTIEIYKEEGYKQEVETLPPKKQVVGALSPQVGKSAPVPYQDLVKIYHDTLPELPRVLALNEARRAHMRSLWKNYLPERDAWLRYFERIRGSPFLMGKVDGRNGRAPFRADIDFLLRPSTALKIFEGKYDGS